MSAEYKLAHLLYYVQKKWKPSHLNFHHVGGKVSATYKWVIVITKWRAFRLKMDARLLYMNRWTVTANVLNNQLQIITVVGYTSYGLGVGATNLHKL